MTKLSSRQRLKQYFQRMSLVETINTLVPPKAEELSCGEAVAALVAMILNRRHALYNLEHWAQESAVLVSILYGIGNSVKLSRRADTRSRAP